LPARYRESEQMLDLPIPRAVLSGGYYTDLVNQGIRQGDRESCFTSGPVMAFCFHSLKIQLK